VKVNGIPHRRVGKFPRFLRSELERWQPDHRGESVRRGTSPPEKPPQKSDITAITVKFRGLCAECGAAVMPGKQAFWNPGTKKIWHWLCLPSAQRLEVLRRGDGKSVIAFSGGLPTLGKKR
jgi:hypothetical protein